MVSKKSDIDILADLQDRCMGLIHLIEMNNVELLKEYGATLLATNSKDRESCKKTVDLLCNETNKTISHAEKIMKQINLYPANTDEIVQLKYQIGKTLNGWFVETT